MDADHFRRCCALASSASLSLEQRRAAEATLLQLRRSPLAAEVCAEVLLSSDVTAAFHAAVTLKFSTLFNWPRLCISDKSSALLQMWNALTPPSVLSSKEWLPVQNQALLALSLYWKKAFVEGTELIPARTPLVAAAICQAMQDDGNLSLLALTRAAHLAAKRRFAASLPGLLQGAAAEANHEALAACAAWTFDAPSDGWAESCAQVSLALARSGSWCLALDFAAHCRHLEVMWDLVLGAARANIYAAAVCAAQLQSRPSALQCMELAKLAVELMKEDLSSEDGLELLDALVNLLDVMSRQHSPDVSKVLLEGFFAQVVARANLPDCYDETLEGKTDCSDVLHFMALVAGDCRRTVEVTRQLLAQPANQEASMDVMHVALSFAAELVEVNNFASSLAPTVCTALPGLSSPLLVADSLRFLQRLLRRTGESFSRLPPEDVEHIFRALLAALRWAADPDVCRVSLAILSLLSQYPGAFVLFQSHFQAFNDADLPLDLTTGFCSGARRAAPDLSAAQQLARPLQLEALSQLRRWDPRSLSCAALRQSGRRFAALAGLVPLGALDDELLADLHERLCGKFPEHLLPCAAPLLAALAREGGQRALDLAEAVCVAMASAPASLGLQEACVGLVRGLAVQAKPGCQRSLGDSVPALLRAAVLRTSVQGAVDLIRAELFAGRFGASRSPHPNACGEPPGAADRWGGGAGHPPHSASCAGAGGAFAGTPGGPFRDICGVYFCLSTFASSA
ncbi:unnamed protein product [Effrenium voratum]|nr:unnamed protein product [Effrenium voratum]